MARPRKPPRLKRRGNVWRIVDGETEISTGTGDDAMARQALAEYCVGKAAPPKPPTEPTVRDLVSAYVESRSTSNREKHSSFVVNSKGLVRHLGDLRLYAVNQTAVNQYVAQRRRDEKRTRRAKPVADGTIVRELAMLRAALNWAGRADGPAWFPRARDHRPLAFEMPVSDGEARRHWLTKDQARLAIDTCHLPHLRRFIRIGLATGARKEAIEDLKWSQVDFERRHIDFGIVSHNKKRPLITLSDELYDDLKAAHAIRCSEWVIEYNGRKAGDVKKSFKVLANKLCWPWFTPHVLKHTCITWLVQAGIPYGQVAHLVNTSVKIIEKHYGHHDPKTASAMAEALSLGLSAVREPRETTAEVAA
jgi:integrase